MHGACVPYSPVTVGLCVVSFPRKGMCAYCESQLSDDILLGIFSAFVVQVTHVIWTYTVCCSETELSVVPWPTASDSSSADDSEE
jgi:hypothetical protein